MDLSTIRNLSEGYEGGLKRLASDIGMSEANLHRCINNNKIQASDLEQISIRLGVSITIFFDQAIISDGSRKIEPKTNAELLQICKLLVENYQQRDSVMNKLVSMVNKIG